MSIKNLFYNNKSTFIIAALAVVLLTGVTLAAGTETDTQEPPQQQLENQEQGGGDELNKQKEIKREIIKPDGDPEKGRKVINVKPDGTYTEEDTGIQAEIGLEQYKKVKENPERYKVKNGQLWDTGNGPAQTTEHEVVEQDGKTIIYK